MAYMKNLHIRLHNEKPVICENCKEETLHVLSEEGIMWCSNCGHTNMIDYDELTYEQDDYIHNIQGREK